MSDPWALLLTSHRSILRLQQKRSHTPQTNVLGETVVNEFLDLGPSLLEGDVDCRNAGSTQVNTVLEWTALTGVDLAVEPPPFLRELRLGGNVLERDGEVDEVKVEVIEAPELE